ncbi:hypothetical protein Pcinc_032285 [Petrolisthes cinctipes]|uniref:Uncharacterized protein n=1 Tax=Petrolisthes cinctipes TaxID=88211 RepID=A0AAE1JZG3_PETCI|nr:hypothetical protein Pcinc_032285 [Petrolisthes cinctipes]
MLRLACQPLTPRIKQLMLLKCLDNFPSNIFNADDTVSGWDGPWVELPSVSRCTLAFTLMIPSPSTSLSPAVPDSLQ